jgi:hypothetical protein
MALARKADLKLKAGETSITHLKVYQPPSRTTLWRLVMEV